MVVLVLVDTVVGAIPILGTIFDWLFVENVMNVNALLRYRDRTRPPRSTSSIFGAAVVVVIVIGLVAFFVVTALVLAIIWIANQR
jgi:hypothetical protein